MRDGRGERITKAIDSTPIDPVVVSCGGVLGTPSGGRYRICSLGHVHCTYCRNEARRFRKGWTCGGCL